MGEILRIVCTARNAVKIALAAVTANPLISCYKGRNAATSTYVKRITPSISPISSFSSDQRPMNYLTDFYVKSQMIAIQGSRKRAGARNHAIRYSASNSSLLPKLTCAKEAGPAGSFRCTQSALVSAVLVLFCEQPNANANKLTGLASASFASNATLHFPPKKIPNPMRTAQ